MKIILPFLLLISFNSFSQTKPSSKSDAELQKIKAKQYELQLKEAQANKKNSRKIADLSKKVDFIKHLECTHIDTSDFSFKSEFKFSTTLVDETNARLVDHPEYGKVKFQEKYKVSSYARSKAGDYIYTISPKMKYTISGDSIILSNNGKKVVFQYCSVY